MVKGGMPLRDYFAAKAMVGFMQALADNDLSPQDEIVNIAAASYAMADAMLKANAEK